MHAITLLTLALAPFVATSLIQTRQYPDPYSPAGAFLLQTRNQDVSRGNAEYNLLVLAQAADESGAPSRRARLTWTGEATRFRLRAGVLSAHLDYTDRGGGAKRGKWRDATRTSGASVDFEVDGAKARKRAGTMSVEVGTHAFLNPGGNYTESDWTYCRGKMEGTPDYGLAIGNVVDPPGYVCHLVYVFLVDPDDYYSG